MWDVIFLIDAGARAQRRVGGQSEDFDPCGLALRRDSASAADLSELTSYTSMMSREATYKRQKETNKIADELSRLVVYTKAVKFDRLPSIREFPLSWGSSSTSGPSVLDESTFPRREGSIHSYRERSMTPSSSRHRSSSDAGLMALAARSFKKRGSASGESMQFMRNRAPSGGSRSSQSGDSFSVTGQLAQSSFQGMMAGSYFGAQSFVDLMRAAEPPKAFQTSSLAENSAKKLCKKQACEVVVYVDVC